MADQRERGMVKTPSRAPRGGEFSCGDAVLVSFQHLVLQRQPARIHAKLAVHVAIAPALEAHIALLRAGRDAAGMPQRNQLVGLFIDEAHARGDRPPGLLIDHTAQDRFSRDGGGRLRLSGERHTCAGCDSQEIAPSKPPHYRNPRRFKCAINSAGSSEMIASTLASISMSQSAGVFAVHGTTCNPAA